MKLQILVTHYNEDEKTVATLLDSIEMQKGIDFDDLSVIIVNDGDQKILSPNFLEKYSFNIRYEVLPKRTVSYARNCALDIATAKYVMFCDCDDAFCVDCALKWIFDEMEVPFNVLNSVFFEERGGRGIPRENDNTFIHGKVWSREYLKLEDIRFADDLYVHEDGYFVCLAQSCAGTIRYFDKPFYVWKERKGSVARQPNYIQETWKEYLKAKNMLIGELVARDKESVAKYVVAQLLIEARERHLNKENERATLEFYLLNKYLHDALTDDEKKLIEKSTSELFKHKTTCSPDYFMKLLDN